MTRFARKLQFVRCLRKALQCRAKNGQAANALLSSFLVPLISAMQCGEQRYAAYRSRINSGIRAFCRMQRTLRRPSVFVTWRRPRLSITVVPCALLITSCRINALVAAGWLAFPAESINRHWSRRLADETRAQPVPK